MILYYYLLSKVYLINNIISIDFKIKKDNILFNIIQIMLTLISYMRRIRDS